MTVSQSKGALGDKRYGSEDTPGFAEKGKRGPKGGGSEWDLPRLPEWHFGKWPRDGRYEQDVYFFPSDNVCRLRCSLCCTSASLNIKIHAECSHTIDSRSELRSLQCKPSYNWNTITR
jgi:hypothetical protein